MQNKILIVQNKLMNKNNLTKQWTNNQTENPNKNLLACNNSTWNSSNTIYEQSDIKHLQITFTIKVITEGSKMKALTFDLI